jgi:ribonuclease I
MALDWLTAICEIVISALSCQNADTDQNYQYFVHILYCKNARLLQIETIFQN